MKPLKPSVTLKRLETIEGLQGGIRKLIEQFIADFPTPPALSGVIDKELADAVESLEMLAGLYKAKTEKR